MKRCPHCGRAQSLDAFGPCTAREHLDGKQNWCRECQRTASRQRHHANREEALQSSRAYHRTNRERIRERQASYSESQGYARRKGARIVEPVYPLVVLERNDGVCGICGEDVDPFAFELDHVVPLAAGGEHSYANVQLAHPFCNRHKGERPMEAVAA